LNRSGGRNERPWRYPIHSISEAGQGAEDVRLGGRPPIKSRSGAGQKLIQGLTEKAGDGVELFVLDGHVARKIAFQCQGRTPDVLTASMGSSPGWAGSGPGTWALLPPSGARRASFRRWRRFGHAMWMTIATLRADPKRPMMLAAVSGA
jgi:hypothetical protein